jgi:hypothetical protein
MRVRLTSLLTAALLAVILVVATSCALNPFAPSALKASDGISYQVSATGVTGNTVIVLFTVPVGSADPSGVRQQTVPLPFASGVIGGYSQFTGQHPSITVTADGTPACVDVYVMANAKEVDHQHDCKAHVVLTASK